MKDLVIVGAGGLAREAAFVVEEINRVSPTWHLRGFIGESAEQVGSSVGKYAVVGTDDALDGWEVSVTVAIGNPAVIERVVARHGENPRLEFPNLIHPGAVFDRERVRFGRGNIVTAGCVFTTDIEIGSFNYFNLCCTCGHDAVIGDFCVVNPTVNLSGGVRLGNGCLIGTGAQVLQYVTIGAGATVGAGSVVTKEVEAGTTVVGVPARPR